MRNIKKALIVMPVLLVLFGFFTYKVSATSVTLTPISPPSVSEPYTVFDVNITISDVTNLYAWQIVLWFQNDVLHAVNATEGPFLKQVGDTYFGFQPENIVNDYNETHGYIFVGCSGLWDPALGGANGTGGLCTIKFNGTGIGLSDLVIGNCPSYITYLEDHNENPISFDVTVTEVNVIPEFQLMTIALIMLLSTSFIIFYKKKKPLDLKP